MYGPILEKVATLTEMDTTYTLHDLLDLNEALDFQSAVKKQKMEESKRGSR
jgi:hypothetical protein